MAEDVKSARCQARRSEIPPEAPIERAAGNSARSGPSEPERCSRVHRRRLDPTVRQRCTQRFVGRARQLSPPALAALTSVGIEGDAVLDADVAGGEAQD